MMVLFLNGNALCNARPMELQDIQGEHYRLLVWQCGERGTPEGKTFRIWSRQCPPQAKRGEATWWSRPFLLEELTSGHGFYLNRFAELQSGWHVLLDDTYYPDCGS